MGNVSCFFLVTRRFHKTVLLGYQFLLILFTNNSYKGQNKSFKEEPSSFLSRDSGLHSVSSVLTDHKIFLMLRGNKQNF